MGQKEEKGAFHDVQGPIKKLNMPFYRMPLMFYMRSHFMISCHACDVIVRFVTPLLQDITYTLSLHIDF